MRNSRQSNWYSPTTSAISSFSAGGNVYGLSIDGVRKQLTIRPRSGFGGNVPGTPRTIDVRPARPTISQSRGALIAVESAMKAPS